MELPSQGTEPLKKLLAAKMPFGKHVGMRLIDLPEPYLVWFSKVGFPEGEIGEMLRAVYEIKLNGLERLFQKPQNPKR